MQLEGLNNIIIIDNKKKTKENITYHVETTYFVSTWIIGAMCRMQPLPLKL